MKNTKLLVQILTGMFGRWVTVIDRTEYEQQEEEYQSFLHRPAQPRRRSGFAVRNTDDLSEARFRSELGQTVRLKNTFGIDTAVVTIGETQTVLKAEDEMFTFILSAGAEAVIRKVTR